MFSGNDANIDSIVYKQTKDFSRRGFWIVGGHGTPMPDKAKLKGLDTAYTLLKERTFYDAWALFYMSKRFMTANYIFIKYDDFAPGTGSVLTNEKQIAIWKGAISTKPVAIKKGTFKMAISAMGTSAANVFPHLNIYMNGKKIANYFVTGNMEEKSFDFDIDSDMNATFTIEMDNDFQVPPNQDRNTFVQYIIIKPVKPGAAPAAPK